jgi:YidC/Oxa1 family membrane protein insertase
MDKNTWVGFLLIAAIIVGFTMLNRPSKEQIAERQRVQDSIKLARMAELEAQRISDSLQYVAGNAVQAETISEEEQQAHMQAAYGTFAQAAQGEEQWVTLENEHLRLTLSTLGGRIQRAELPEYHASGDSVNPLCLFRADESTFGFTLITANNRILQTSNLYFTPVETAQKNKAILRLKTASPDAWLDFVYELSDSYMVHLSLEPHNMQSELAQNINSLELQWRQLIPQQEQGRKFEERYARLQYMLVGGDMEELSESKDDSEKEAARVKWIGYKDQFFSTVLIADDAFSSSQFSSTLQSRHSGYIKQYTTHTSVPFDLTGKTYTGFRFYLGPNHYHTLKAYDEDLARDERLHLNKLVPLGWKIVSWINTALVIPMFDLFTSWGLHIGIVILLMTLVIKLIILPFVFVSYKSSAKMRVLRPQIDAINEKYPAEKMQERQAATMQLYQQAGVSPMSGCLPMLFQFPVLMAMFWFLPTAIELRGKSLLWADDLSTYDAVFQWGFNLPLIGDHLSLFALLMAVVMWGYSKLTMSQQSAGNDPSAKSMQFMSVWMMPIMMFFICNSLSAALSYYYLLSQLISMVEIWVIRKWIVKPEAVLARVKAAEGKPEKKSKWMQRLEEAQRMQEQQMRQQQKNRR